MPLQFVQEGAQVDFRTPCAEGAIDEAEIAGLAPGERAPGFDQRRGVPPEQLPQPRGAAEAGEAAREAEERVRGRHAEPVVAR